MYRLRVPLLTALAMLAFAGNSLLCRLALRNTGIDAASFTGVRILAGSLVLGAFVYLRHRRLFSNPPHGNWLSALALFVYAAAFSLAYQSLPAGSGALILFGAVQLSMIGHGLWRGERLNLAQSGGFLLAFAGLLLLFLPGLSAPPLRGALLMLAAGLAWGVYSLRGRGAGDPTRVTTGNFLRATVLAVLFCAVSWPTLRADTAGLLYAATSGAVASGFGYAIWYAALRGLKATQAASVQLSVPVLAAFGGSLFLHEAIGWRLLLASLAILGGIALVIAAYRPWRPRR